jgi:predicted Zn finger-like uncharacterized protein
MSAGMQNAHFPERHKFSHEYAIFLQDLLANVVVSGSQHGIFKLEVTLDSEEKGKLFENVPQMEILDWLQANGEQKALSDFLERLILPRVLADYCHFVFEALSCSRRGKLTVAYSNLRKPFKDNLFYLEWLLVEPSGFTKAFMSGDPKQLEDRLTTFASRHQIIEKAIMLTESSDLYDVELMEDLRYNRTADHGFAASWDQAAHLITTRKTWATSPQNFNFVFSDRESVESQWDFLYFRLPTLLHYTVEVVEGLLGRIVSDYVLKTGTIRLRRKFGHILWVEHVLGKEESKEFGGDSLEDLPPIPCPRCHAHIRFDRSNLLLGYRAGRIRCGGCGEVIDLDADSSAHSDSQ